MKHDLADRKEAKRLARAMKISPVYSGMVLGFLQAFATKECPNGDLAPVWDDFGFEVESCPGLNGDTLKTAMIEAGILFELEGALIISDWSTEAPDFVHARLARAKQTFADGTFPKPCKLRRSELEDFEAWRDGGDERRPAAANGCQRRPAADNEMNRTKMKKTEPNRTATRARSGGEIFEAEFSEIQDPAVAALAKSLESARRRAGGLSHSEGTAS